jgi:hypothetical protein
MNKAAAVLLLAIACACGSESPGSNPLDPPPPDDDDGARVALTDLCGNGRYLGMFEGCLYPRSNEVPADHAARVQAVLALVQPRSLAGTLDPTGKIVAVSLGESTTRDIFCMPTDSGACRSHSVTATAAADPAVNHTTLVLVNGAQGGQTSQNWTLDTQLGRANYDRIDSILLARGLSPAQVQVIISPALVRHPKRNPPPLPELTLPDTQANAYRMVADFARAARTMRQRWPNVQLWFPSGYFYGGYDLPDGQVHHGVVTEPWSYESGFALKWVIEAQIEQMRTGAVDPIAGDLSPAVAPIILQGPYLWADAEIPRSDGLFWPRSDFSDGKHLNVNSGLPKAVALIMDFFKTNPFTQCWFLAGRTCPL